MSDCIIQLTYCHNLEKVRNIQKKKSTLYCGMHTCLQLQKLSGFLKAASFFGTLLPQSVVAVPYDLAIASSECSSKLAASLKLNGEEDISILASQRVFGHVPTSALEMAIDYFFYDAEIAEPPRVTSLKNVEPIPTYEYFGEDEYFVADSRGYEYLVHILAMEFLQTNNSSIVDDRLQINKVVHEIHHSEKGIKVLVEDGSVYNANHVIVSVSLGVLQTKLIKFQPDLPRWKLLSIFKFDMVDFTKIYLKFPYKFWPSGPGTESFIYADEKRGYYTIWKASIHLENVYPGSNILLVTITDDESRRIEQQSDHETKAEAMAVLRRMFGMHIPEAEEILVPRWWKNRFYCGTFCNWPIGVTTKDFDELKAPIGQIYFTGEHTNTKFNGYVHGAYLSGIEI
eukprot:Gb_10592 [translate_table: standard]